MPSNKLPYFSPDKDFHLNSGIIILVLDKLSTTKKGKLVVNNEQLLNFYYLIKKPLLMNKVLESFGKKPATLTEAEVYSVDSLSLNADPLFDREKIRTLLKSISSHGYLSVEHRKSSGFMYTLTENGKETAQGLTDGFFVHARKYIKHLTAIQSKPQHALAKVINDSLKNR